MELMRDGLAKSLLEINNGLCNELAEHVVARLGGDTWNSPFSLVRWQGNPLRCGGKWQRIIGNTRTLVRNMKQPKTHENLHPSCRDAWDPYAHRDSHTPMLDRTTFRALLVRNDGGEFIDPVLFMHGCLDAPMDIPCGGTACVSTAGGWMRESYMRIPRGMDDWKGYESARFEVGALIRKLMSKTEAQER